MIRFGLVLVFLLLPVLAFAQGDPAQAVRRAQADLEAAERLWTAALKARDPQGALVTSLRAFETALPALQVRLRALAALEQAQARNLAARQGDVAQLLGALHSLQNAPPPRLMLHPAGPLGSARAGMMREAVLPAVQARLASLRADLDGLAALRAAQSGATRALQRGAVQAQEARAALTRRVSERSDIVRRFVEDPVRTAILLDSVDNLGAFIANLEALTAQPLQPTQTTIEAERGTLSLPVTGVVVRRSGKPEETARYRDGITIAAPAKALVTNPFPAFVRFAGVLPKLGEAVILEPQGDVLFVFSGFDTVFARTGEVLPRGEPLGFLPGSGAFGVNPSTSGEGGGLARQDALYIEVREGGSPVDPESWFDTETDG